MTRGGWLLGAAIFGAGVLGMGIGGSAVAAPITAAHLGPAGFGLANPGGDAVRPAFAEWMPAATFAARRPGVDPGGFLGGPADGGPEEGVGPTAAGAVSSLGEAAEALLAALGRLPLHDPAPVLPAAEGWPRLPGGPEGAADALIVTTPRAAGETAIAPAGGDPLVEYAVPALAAASLPAAGLLFFGLLRRRRRAALARRIRSASVRYGSRLSRRRSS